MDRYLAIPEELRVLKQWVCVRSDSKVPMCAAYPAPASSSNPDTWSTYQQAVQAVSEGKYDGIGFVFNDNDLVGIDVDAGYDEEGFISPVAAKIIGACRSYTERSRSGRGFHILIKGALPFKGKNNMDGVEIYRTGRYFIMTGDVLLFRELREDQEAIDQVVTTYFPEARKQGEGRFVGRKIYTPVWEKPEGGRIRLRPVYPRIPDGCRNICLTSLAGMLHNQGYSKGQIYAEIAYCNTVACTPELPSWELQTIVNSVTRYKR